MSLTQLTEGQKWYFYIFKYLTYIFKCPLKNYKDLLKYPNSKTNVKPHSTDCLPLFLHLLCASVESGDSMAAWHCKQQGGHIRFRVHCPEWIRRGVEWPWHTFPDFFCFLWPPCAPLESTIDQLRPDDWSEALQTPTSLGPAAQWARAHSCCSYIGSVHNHHPEAPYSTIDLYRTVSGLLCLGIFSVVKYDGRVQGRLLKMIFQ